MDDMADIRPYPLLAHVEIALLLMLHQPLHEGSGIIHQTTSIGVNDLTWQHEYGINDQMTRGGGRVKPPSPCLHVRVLVVLSGHLERAARRRHARVIWAEPCVERQGVWSQQLEPFEYNV